MAELERSVASEPSPVRRLLYVSAVPAPASDADAPDGPPADMTHLVFGDGTVVPDQE